MTRQPSDHERRTDTSKTAKGAKGLLDRYIRTASSPSLDSIRETLWSNDGQGHWPQRDNAEYRTALIEQYKIYVEMADRISSRRGTANTFFLTLNTAIATVVGVFWQRPPQAAPWILLIPWLALLAQCAGWFEILRSYRQLNTAKYAVVGALEERLPASPYWSAEWAALGFGEDPTRYWPLSHVEGTVPLFFAVVYTAGLAFALFA